MIARHGNGGGDRDRRQARSAPAPPTISRAAAWTWCCVDQHAMGSQTSARAAGLTSKTASTPVMAALRHEACEAFERFESELGRASTSTARGASRRPIREAGEARLLADFAVAHGLGIEARAHFCSGSGTCLAPHFEPGAARAIGHVPSDGWLDPAKVAVSFAARAAELGARMLPVHPGDEVAPVERPR